MNDTPKPETVDDLLVDMSKRVRGLRAARGMSRKDLSKHADISERYLAQLESGQANASLGVLWRLADAMGVDLINLLVNDEQVPRTNAPLWRLLQSLSAKDQLRAYEILVRRFGSRDNAARHGVALVGLRGAGKTTLGRQLAADAGVDFVRLGEVVESVGGMELWEMFSLAGQKTYRRAEREALQTVINRPEPVVLEAGGSIVSEPATFNLLLANFYTVWLRAAPHEHMERVLGQGDTRPMEASEAAMADLKRILSERESDYGRADAVVNTSERGIDDCLTELRRKAARHLEPAGSSTGQANSGGR